MLATIFCIAANRIISVSFMIKDKRMHLHIELLSKILYQLMNTLQIYGWLNAISLIKHISSFKKYKQKQICFRVVSILFIVSVMGVEITELFFIHIAYITNTWINWIILCLYLIFSVLLIKRLKRSYSLYLKERNWIWYITVVVCTSIVIRIADTFVFQYW